MRRTQLGNNNAYAQDNETTWVDWTLNDAQRALLHFTRRVIAVRLANPVWRRRSFFRGGKDASGMRDVTWLAPSGLEMHDADWADAERGVLGMLIDGNATDAVDDQGRALRGDTVLFLVSINKVAKVTIFGH